ncbi:MAG: hypothetical protein R2861_11695 [Desulfobacterales bacterium]
MFELGKIFISNGQDTQPTEKEMLAGLWTGVRRDMTSARQTRAMRLL